MPSISMLATFFFISTLFFSYIFFVLRACAFAIPLQPPLPKVTLILFHAHLLELQLQFKW